MKKPILIFLLLCLVVSVAAQSSKTPDLDKVNQLIDEYVQEQNIPSVVVGIIKGGALVEVISRGETSRGSGVAVNGQTLYQIGSLSKSFTAIIMNSLAADGMLKLESSLADMLKGDIPDEALKQYESISLIQVLQHRAALPNNGASVPPTPNGTAMKGGYHKEALLKDLAALKLESDKIGNFAYSNMGFALLGYLAEKVSGKSYEALIQQYVAQPLGMTSTTSLHSQEVYAAMATPYMVGGDRTRETSAWEMGLSAAGGGVFSNIEDLSKLMLAEMKAYDDFKTSGQSTPLVLTANTETLNPYMRYGYGFFESKNTFDSTVVQLGHGGDLDGFASQYEFYPEHDLGLIMLTASGFGGWNEIKSRVERVMLGIPLPPEVSLTKEVVKRYTGTYQFESGSTIKLYRKGSELKAYIKGWGGVTLYAQNETRFNWRDRNAAFEFEVDGKGKITKAIYHENGNQYFPKKIK